MEPVIVVYVLVVGIYHIVVDVDEHFGTPIRDRGPGIVLIHDRYLIRHQAVTFFRIAPCSDARDALDMELSGHLRTLHFKFIAIPQSHCPHHLADAPREVFDQVELVPLLKFL